MSTEMSFPSKVPRRSYASTLDEQLGQLKTDEQMLQFVESRKRFSSDRYRPVYHFVSPEGILNDPHGLCYWQGRYHLFYQAYPPKDLREHWGHAFSDDLVHWQDLPLAIYPGIEERCFSGGTLVEDDRVIAMYRGTRGGTKLSDSIIAVSSDPLLLNWEKIPGNPVIPLVPEDDNGLPYRVRDSCIWKEANGYHALLGSEWYGRGYDNCRMVQHLFFSQNLRRWKYLGPFVEGDIFTMPGEDGACPNFWPIGEKHILLFVSHQQGSQYLIGDYDTVYNRFKPFAHGRFNFGALEPGGVHAPSATPDGRGGVFVIHNINNGKEPEGKTQIMSLVRVLRLGADNKLSIEPVPATESLRHQHRHVGATLLPANQEIVLDGIQGNAIELSATIDPQAAREVCLNVLRSPAKEEYTSISFYRHGYIRRIKRDAIAIDPSRSSLRPDVFARPPEVAPFELVDGEPLRLRVFIDKSVVEVFAGDKQCVTLRVYPERNESVGVSIRAQGSDAMLLSFDAWQMRSIS